jgi:ATP-dependent RNA helicase DOB1
MGLNMPAKTAVFTALEKFDGTEMRAVKSGEYIQMSGRAGRRGKDPRGTIIVFADAKLREEDCRAMMTGASAPLLSSFKLSNYTLLNLLKRVEGTAADMAAVIGKSFSQFQQELAKPKKEAEARALRARAAAAGARAGAAGAVEGAAEEYAALKEELRAAGAEVMAAVLQPQRCLHFLRPGRVVRVVDGAADWGYGVVVSVVRAEGGGAAAYWVDTLLCCADAGGKVAPAPLDAPRAEMRVVPVALSLLAALSTLRISIPPDLTAPKARRAVLDTVRELAAKYPGGALPLLDPVADVGVTEPAALAAAARAAAAEKKLARNAVARAERAPGGSAAATAALREQAELLARADALQQEAKQSDLASFNAESACRIALLRRLGFVGADDVITLKGRAACEVDTADELLATELMFNGVFAALDVHQLAALVSCLVPVEKSAEEVQLTRALAAPLAELRATARRLAAASIACGLDKVVEEEYVESFKPALMDVVHAWSKGASFQQVCEVTDLFEGSLVRALRRLDELMAQLERAAAAVGDARLAAHFAASRETMRRGLPFAASLYI